MTEKQPVVKKSLTADWLMQGALTRIGDALDRLTGRRWTPSSSLATSELIERLKKLMDSEAIEVAGKGTVVPHNIKLKMQWDKFSTDAKETITKLEDELLIAAADHINDRLYYTYAPLNIEVKPDYFTEGVKLFVSFAKFGDEDHEAELNVTLPSIDLVHTQTNKGAYDGSSKLANAHYAYMASFKINHVIRVQELVFDTEGRMSVGRTGSNDLILDDVSVSKIHASLVADAKGSLSVADTGSTNGTFINDVRIAYGKAVKLVEGDRVKFGSIEVVFERVKDPSAVVAAGGHYQPSDSLSKVDTQPVDGPTETTESSVSNEVDK